MLEHTVSKVDKCDTSKVGVIEAAGDASFIHSALLSVVTLLWMAGVQSEANYL